MLFLKNRPKAEVGPKGFATLGFLGGRIEIVKGAFISSLVSNFQGALRSASMSLALSSIVRKPKGFWLNIAYSFRKKSRVLYMSSVLSCTLKPSSRMEFFQTVWSFASWWMSRYSILRRAVCSRLGRMSFQPLLRSSIALYNRYVSNVLLSFRF